MGHLTREELRRCASRRTGRGGVDAGVHLHTRGNAQGRDVVSHRAAQIPRRAVSSRKDDQVYGSLGHFDGRAARILG